MVDYRDILGIRSLSDEAESGRGVKVAVLDTGIPHTSSVPVDCSMNFTNEPSGSSEHATFIGSILFGHDSVAGICRNAVSCFGKVFETVTAKPSTVARAIRYAVDEWKVDIINLSLGFSRDDDCPASLKSACDYACSKGVTIVAAAGNDGGRVLWPAALKTVVCVGSSAGSVKESFSNYGDVDLVVPGSDICGLNAEGELVTKTGTSFSTALVTGLLVLILARRRKNRLDTSPASLKDELIDMCIDIGVAGWDELTGYGFPFAHLIGEIGQTSSTGLIGASIFVKIKEITRKVIKALIRRIKGDE